MNQQEQAAKLLEMIAVNPTKIDLIESLAKKAGWIGDMTPVALDRDLKPEKSAAEESKKKPAPRATREKNKGGRPKKNAAEGPDGKRRLNQPEFAIIDTLVNGGMPKTKIAEEIGVKASTLYSALDKKGNLPKKALEKLGKMTVQEAAE